MVAVTSTLNTVCGIRMFYLNLSLVYTITAVVVETEKTCKDWYLSLTRLPIVLFFYCYYTTVHKGSIYAYTHSTMIQLFFSLSKTSFLTCMGIHCFDLSCIQPNPSVLPSHWSISKIFLICQLCLCFSWCVFLYLFLSSYRYIHNVPLLFRAQHFFCSLIKIFKCWGEGYIA